jgi:REP element-mobilizing transposase RayT
MDSGGDGAPRAEASASTRRGPARAPRAEASASTRRGPARAPRAEASASTRRGPARGEAGEQLSLFGAGWGGTRKGAGRTRKVQGRTPHRARPRHYHGHPVHVTLRARFGPLRSQVLYPTIRLAIQRAAHARPEAFRVVHYSVQSNHVHLLVEAGDRRALSAGVRGLAVRIALYLNGILMRKGPVWADRWHGRALTSPREVRHALVYVLANFRKHGGRGTGAGIDPYSSGPWFDGWREWHPTSGAAPRFAGRAPPRSVAEGGAPVTPARSWLLSRGFRRAGLVSWSEAPRASG